MARDPGVRSRTRFFSLLEEKGRALAVEWDGRGRRMVRGGFWMGARLVVLSAVLVAGLSEAREVGGVKMPDTLQLQGRQLELAHMALKEKLFFNVYVWGLYMEQVPRVQSEAIAANSLKQLHFRFLRKVRRDQLLDAFRQGLSSNADLRSGPLQQQLETLLTSLKDVSKGDNLVITYVPETGLQVSGEASGGVVIPGKPFADALFSAWLHRHPVFAR
ncbi:chalcone isomerase family protein [Stigmatella sp. ncwal1]|uniref:Chalcone isomerase family protein n=1 Tax=Stigmatella ashevillensis TaxID=2995309 RepID=A0ABT5DCG7_9BACT|nr:chalcone isomerase family protein [Stigmatella ashevillena]MDC0710493.1 chalcone isomerase family protein [Stigmatella ashevillena]